MTLRTHTCLLQYCHSVTAQLLLLLPPILSRELLGSNDPQPPDNGHTSYWLLALSNPSVPSKMTMSTMRLHTSLPKRCCRVLMLPLPLPLPSKMSHAYQNDSNSFHIRQLWCGWCFPADTHCLTRMNGSCAMKQATKQEGTSNKRQWMTTISQRAMDQQTQLYIVAPPTYMIVPNIALSASTRLWQWWSHMTIQMNVHRALHTVG